MREPFDLRVPLRPSRRLAVLLGVLYALSGLLIVGLADGFVWVLLLAGLLVWQSVGAWRFWRWLQTLQGVRVVGEHLELLLPEGTQRVALREPVLLTRGLVILPLKTPQGVRCLPLLSDSAPVEAFRQLRVWLQCRATS